MAGASSFLEGIESVDGVRAGFVGRVPGVTVGRDKWTTLDELEPAHRRAVRELGFEWEDLWRAEQVHGVEVAEVPGGGTPPGGRIVAGVDGLLTGVPGVLLGIYVADCAAVYLADRGTGALGLLHSGRKGTEGGIVTRGLERMREIFGTDPAEVEAAISPCIRPPRYEVDLAGAIGRELVAAGVAAGRVRDSGECTGRNLGAYYSYRVEKGRTGRMLALLGRAGGGSP